jgi:alginate export protein
MWRLPLRRRPAADRGVGMVPGLVLALVASGALAEGGAALPKLEIAGPLDSTIRVEGSNRVRGEVWSFFETAPTSPVPNSNYSFLGNKFQLGVRVRRDPFEFFAQLQDSVIAPAPVMAAGAGGQYWFNTKRETIHEPIFRQGWVRARDLFTVPGLTTVLGRQLYRDGLEAPARDATLAWLQKWRIADRLIGPFDYTHVGRSFDGGQLTYERGPFNVTGFGFVPTAGGYEVSANREIPNMLLGGLALTAKESARLPGTTGRLFYIYYDDHRPIVFLDNRPESVRVASKGRAANIHTVGANAMHVHALGPGYLDLLAWAAGQGGDWQGQTQAAWAYALEAGYQLPAVWGAPWLRGGFNSGSGDTDPTDGTHGTFDQLLPTARTYAQFPFYNLMNNQDVFVQLILRPHRLVSLRVDGHWLRATSSRDLVYSGGGATSQHNFGYGGTPTGGENELAYVTDLGVTVTPAEFLTVSTYYGHAFGQGVIRQAYVGRDADYGYMEVTVAF